MTTTAKYTPAKRLADYRCTYPRQLRPQNSYFELDTETGEVYATYDPEVGNAIPFRVYNGIDRRYGFASELKMKDVNALAKKLLPLWQRVVDGTSVEWDGNNNVAVLNPDAYNAEIEIRELIYKDERAADIWTNR